ncbi:hypothetical protein E4T56_gene15445, partial [Termitomyces sp. T112]
TLMLTIIGPGLARFERQMAAVMTGHADLGIAAQFFARDLHIAVLRHIVLPQMHAIGIQALGQRDRIVDDEGDFPLGADRLQGGGQTRGGVIVDVLHAELKRRDPMTPFQARIQRARQPLRKIAAHIGGRDQIKLRGRAGVFESRVGPRVFCFAKAAKDLFLALVDVDQFAQHGQRFVARALERVTADDRAIAAAVANVARVLIDGIGALGGPAREDNDAATVEA